MIIVSIIVSFCVIFLAGMHFSLYNTEHIKANLYWALTLSFVGLYNLVGLVGYAVKG